MSTSLPAYRHTLHSVNATAGIHTVRRAAYEPAAGGIAPLQQEGSLRLPNRGSLAAPVGGGNNSARAARPRSPVQRVRPTALQREVVADTFADASVRAPSRPCDASVRSISRPRAAEAVAMPMDVADGPPYSVLDSLHMNRMLQMQQEIMDSVDLKIANAFEDLKSFSAVGLSTLAEQIDAEIQKREEAFDICSRQIEQQTLTSAEVAQNAVKSSLQCFEEVAKSSVDSTLQLESEVDRVRSLVCASDGTQQAITSLREELAELKASVERSCTENSPARADTSSTGMRYLEHSVQELRTQFQLQSETVEEMWHARQRTGTRIGELVCGIEEVATALTSKDQLIRERLDGMQADIRRLIGASKPSTLSLSDFPLSTVREDGEEAESPPEAIREPEAFETIQESSQLSALLARMDAIQGDLNELRARSDQIAAGDSARASKLAESLRESEHKMVSEVGNLLASEVRSINSRIDDLQSASGYSKRNSNSAEAPASGANSSMEDTSAVLSQQGDTGSDGGLTFDARATLATISQLRADVAQLEQKLVVETQERRRVETKTEAGQQLAVHNSSDLAATTGRLSGELSVARAEIAEAVSLANEAMRIVASLKRQADDEEASKYRSPRGRSIRSSVTSPGSSFTGAPADDSATQAADGPASLPEDSAANIDRSQAGAAPSFAFVSTSPPMASATAPLRANPSPGQLGVVVADGSPASSLQATQRIIPPASVNSLDSTTPVVPVRSSLLSPVK